jgi:hypothetical protein
MKVVAPAKGAHLASPTGAVFVLKPGETREIPEYLKRLAFDKGCTPLGDGPVAEPPEDSRSLIRKAIRQMVDEADADAFTAAGKPKIAIVRERSGIEVSVALANEIFDEVMGEHEGS